MKKNSWIIVLLVIVISCNKHGVSPNPPNDPWQKINAPVIGEPLDIKFASADTGYVPGVKLLKQGYSVKKLMKLTDKIFLNEE